MPVEVTAAVEPMEWDEDWDSGSTSLPPALGPGVPSFSRWEDENQQPLRRRNRKRKRREPNPRRQLTKDDYFPRYLDSRESSPPGPPIRSSVTQGGVLRARKDGRTPLDFLGRCSLADADASSANRSAGKPRGDQEMQFPVKTAGVMFGNLVPIPTVPTIDPPPKSCYNCWQRDHLLRHCLQTARRIFCYNCGRHGVNLTSCPRCAEPHRRYMEERKGESAGRRIGSQDGQSTTQRGKRSHPGDSYEGEPRREGRRHGETLPLLGESRERKTFRQDSSKEDPEWSERERRIRDARWREEEELRRREEQAIQKDLAARAAARRAEEAKIEERRKEEEANRRADAARKEAEKQRAEAARQEGERRRAE